MAKPSEKIPVFQLLFERRFDRRSGQMRAEPVTQEEVQDAITTLKADEGLSLGVGNPANFLKDFLRSGKRNEQWPEVIASARYTARQSYGSGKVFEFVPYEPEQTVPFPDDFVLSSDAIIHKVEAVSLPSAARALGRPDEPWLIQVCVHQRILHTHFALYSPLKAVDLFHLQNSLKGTPEIDAVFLLTLELNGQFRKALVTLEAKRNEPILPDQIRGQVALMARQTTRHQGLSDIDFVVPVAVHSHGPRSGRIVGLFEMGMVSVTDALAAYKAGDVHSIPIAIAKSVGYELRPLVAGI